ncbi:type III pantothenate kinase [Parvibium lacunae]|uniref:Type III pantothenate kinase n=1 Tax=Parvibium lacunae TaxID=1888893 RepID=A0A368L0S0_9BURK|nr:type III pantothenate kinase [Parvibium lacunae]RCS57161.1 type III pantothenate kinase [Parvibium lacunae]
MRALTAPALLLDAGNTRLKWALAETCPGLLSSPWLAADHCGAVVVGSSTMATLVEQLAAQLMGVLAGAAPRAIVVCGVRHATAMTALAHELQQRWPDAAFSMMKAQPEFISPDGTKKLHSPYHPSGSLGADRWASLIGAMQGLPDSIRYAVVVNAGTATTIDALCCEALTAESASGAAAGKTAIWRHGGGQILPGLRLMWESLAQGTANLPHPDADAHAPRAIGWGQNTAQALEQGVWDAQIGALLLALSRVSAMPLTPANPVSTTPVVALILAGGHSQGLLKALQDAHLSMLEKNLPGVAAVTLLAVPELVLRGLAFAIPAASAPA